MTRVEVGGSHYTSIAAAALAWAETALPDPSVIEAHEEPQAAAEELLRYWTTEAKRIGEGITPEGVDASEWRTAIVAALVSRIVRGREGATADETVLRIPARDVRVGDDFGEHLRGSDDNAVKAWHRVMRVEVGAVVTDAGELYLADPPDHLVTVRRRST